MQKQVLISTNKKDYLLESLSDRDWFDTGATAQMIACTSDVLVVLDEIGKVYMMALAPIDEPENCITMKDNFRLMCTQVEMGDLLISHISASYKGLCFGVTKEKEVRCWTANFYGAEPEEEHQQVEVVIEVSLPTIVETKDLDESIKMIKSTNN